MLIHEFSSIVNVLPLDTTATGATVLIVTITLKMRLQGR